MLDRDALTTLAAKGEVGQPILRRLWESGLIVCDDITTLDSDDEKVLFFIEITAKGQAILGSKG